MPCVRTIRQFDADRRWSVQFASGRTAVAKVRNLTVLCIGNELVSLNLRCTLLKEHGWTVLSSGGGHDGLVRFRQESVDAVVLDLDSDGSSSALIASELKRQRPEIVVVMLVSDQAQWIAEATAQADAVVSNREETKVLHPMLESLLGRRQSS